MTTEPTTEPTWYEKMGGAETFTTLVHHFYQGVATDPVLRPMYPPGDLAAAENRLRMFLEQYFGGPTTYSEQRGHPRLRARHVPYRIDRDARDRWLDHMRAAMSHVTMSADARSVLWTYLERAADFLVNADHVPRDTSVPLLPHVPTDDN